MCKLHNCEPNNPCHYCKRQAERAKKKPIAPRCDKRAKQEREYHKKRIKILTERKICECGRIGEDGKVCKLPATEIHHISGRIGDLLTDEDNMLPINSECHKWATKNSKQAIEAGLSKSRLKN